MSGARTVRVDTVAAVLTITLDRPATLNALTADSYRELGQALMAAADPTIRAVVVTGAGRGFCSGQDLADSGSDDPAGDLRYVDGTVRGLRALAKPTLCALNGTVAGGGLAFALACDYRLAVSTAKLVPSFLDMALIPDLGCSWFLARMLGYPRAIEWLLSGRRLSAAEALAWGLVSEVVEPDQFTSRTQALAAQFAALPTAAVGLTKQLLGDALSSTLDAQLEREARAQSIAGGTADYREALAAFRDRRPPRFTGR